MNKKLNLQFKNSYAALPENFSTKMKAEAFAREPFLIHANLAAAKLIGLKSEDLKNENFPLYFSGNLELPGSESLAMVYSGHQFGHWAGQLGDGRALLLGQVENENKELWDIQLKGSGKTAYSRFGDGRAVLRSCIREYLCSEILFGLGVPTTRALCIAHTNEIVFRENPEPGAILTRLAKSHIRFGNFEHFYYRKEFEEVKILADYVISNYFPQITKYTDFFTEIVKRTAELIGNWQAIGFCHGVMNSDNMSILGLTIDYGPFGFMENFDPEFICNHSDSHGRYAYDQQPSIGLWNLHALAVALKPLIPFEAAQEILKTYEPIFTKTYKSLMRQKIGWGENDESKDDLWISLLNLMNKNSADYTLSFRYLYDSFDNKEKWLNLFQNKLEAENWLNIYHQQVKQSNSLNLINPKFVLRNWIAELAIRDAEDKQDYKLIDDLLNILHAPYSEHHEFDYLAKPAPKEYQNLCVSCSS